MRDPCRGSTQPNAMALTPEKERPGILMEQQVLHVMKATQHEMHMHPHPALIKRVTVLATLSGQAWAPEVRVLKPQLRPPGAAVTPAAEARFRSQMRHKKKNS
ncbi:hypothetical protein BSL78_08242 [Apostichopus japonicus]|uniref:Uncharacterized protein n=1 Tax=Stichopus japonicus TaxID=307972 RepID=A0A2G8L3T8_STIJA|nr:hypothetical protein BSL78_08242 [Apostichopus japonicus]